MMHNVTNNGVFQPIETQNGTRQAYRHIEHESSIQISYNEEGEGWVITWYDKIWYSNPGSYLSPTVC